MSDIRLYRVMRDLEGKHCGNEYLGNLVTCGECKHREKYLCDEIEFYECSHLRLHGTKVGVTDDWFCADGKRRKDDVDA